MSTQRGAPVPKFSPSVRSHLVIAAVLPVLLLSLVSAAGVFALVREQRDRGVAAKLETVSGFLAESSKVGLLTRRADAIEESIRRALSDSDVRHISVYDWEGQVLGVGGDEEIETIGDARLRIQRGDAAPVALGGGLWATHRVVFHGLDRDADADRDAGDAGSRSPRARVARGEPAGLVRVVLSDARWTSEYRRTLQTGIWIAGLALTAALLMGGLLAQPLLDGISALAQAAVRIGAGDLDVSVPQHHRDELGELGGAFNEMTRQLRQARDQLEAYREHLEQRVAERTRELNAARIDAERTSRAKSEFLANMSHEIRTPLTAVMGYTELLLDDEASLPGEAGRLLEIVHRNGGHLLEIINDILDISKIEAGRLEVERIPMRLIELLSELVSLMRGRAEASGLELSLSFLTPMPSVCVGDPTRVRQSVVNLLSNAIKFTREGSVRMEVRYDADRHIAIIDVIDTGIGIDSERREKLFRPFEQADSSVTRRFGGTGLGLAITQRIAGLLGGDCSAQSTPGRGSRFRFSFAAPIAPGGELVPAEVAGQVTGPSEEETGPGTLNARILLAEDGLDNQRLIGTILRRAGAEVEVADNGLKALDRLQAESFDLVLMDMAMPVMDGYSATRAIRDMGFDVPVIALTAHALSGERERCLEAGCDEYLTKPVDRARLISRARDIIEKRRS
jgi:signal transduction histidine kinase